MLLPANPKDNAVIESFFGYMKDEIYNTNRKQWGKNIITPIEYRNYLLAS